VKIKTLNDKGWEIKIALSETDAENKFTLSNSIQFPENIWVNYEIDYYEYSATFSRIDKALGHFREF